MDDLPLRELFTRLREAGMPLGIQDYELALKALQAGYGVHANGTTAENQAALARLCRTLWVRSTDEQRLLDYHLEQLLNCKARTEPKVPPPKSRILQGAIVAFGLVVIGTGTGFWVIHRNPPDPISKSANSKPASPKPPSDPAPLPGANPAAMSTFESPPLKPPAGLPPISPLIWMVWSVSLVLALGVGGLGLWWLMRRFLKRASDEATESNDNLASELLRQAQDEVQLAQAMDGLHSKPEQQSDRFVLAADYLPVTQRQMKQSWRHLRRMVREGLATELDVATTVRQVARDGILLEPKLMPPRVNRTELVLLLDQDGSMVTFHALSLRLAETAQRGGRLGQAGIYYFHNCPANYLYNDPWCLEAQPIPAVLSQLRRDRTVILIFSDAGAARGGLNFKRVSLTMVFLKQLTPYVRYVVWLNPMPKQRWAGTTAGEIARYVPMFEATRQGLDQAIDVLRGRYLLTNQLHEVTQPFSTQPSRGEP